MESLIHLKNNVGSAERDGTFEKYEAS